MKFWILSSFTMSSAPQQERRSSDVSSRTYWNKLPLQILWSVAPVKFYTRHLHFGQRYVSTSAPVSLNGTYIFKNGLLKSLRLTLCEFQKQSKGNMRTMMQKTTCFPGTHPKTNKVNINVFCYGAPKRPKHKLHSTYIISVFMYADLILDCCISSLEMWRAQLSVLAPPEGLNIFFPILSKKVPHKWCELKGIRPPDVLYQEGTFLFISSSQPWNGGGRNVELRLTMSVCVKSR